MRIAIIADTYPPLKISGAVQMRDLVQEFAAQGHETFVIVPASDLVEPWKIERTGNITILRVRTPPTKRVNYVRRTINELRLPYVLLRAMDASGLRKLRFDGIVWYSPTIFLGPIVKRLRRESGCKSYLILRDIFPEWAVDMGLMRRGPAYWFFKFIERGQYAVADTIGVQTEANRPYMSKWAVKAGRSLEVLQNWLSPAPSVGCTIDVSKTRLAGRKIFVYAGNMGVAQGMDVFIDLLVRMRDRRDIGFLFVGGGSDTARFAATVEREGLDNVLFHKEIEPTEIAGLLEQCDVGIVALDPRHKSHNIPGKFLTYMQAGIPVLARINPHNDLESLINSERVGKVCTGGDAATLQRLVEELVDDQNMLDGAKERGRALWMRLFSTKAAVEQIARAIQSPRSQSVLILNQFFYPDVSATAQHAFDLARYLQNNGDHVSALASRSTYGQTGGRLETQETVDGIRIHRVGSNVFRKRGLLSRSLDFTVFNLASFLKALALPRHDVVICLTTPPFIALIGLCLRWIKGSKFVFWTMDLYPEVPLAAGVIKRGSLTHRIFDRLDRFCLTQADAVVVLGRCMRELVLAKGVDPAKVTTITPWADAEEVRGAHGDGNRATNIYRAEWEIGNRFVIEYSGNCGVGHDVSSVCQAMLELRGDDQIRWVFVGGGVTRPRIEEFVLKHGIKNVIMKPYQPRARLGDLLSLGDAHLVLVADRFEGLLLPSKFYGVMAAARPTIYIGPSASEVAQVIAEENCGFAVANGDCASLVAAIRHLQTIPGSAEAMGARGLAALERAYSTRIGCAAWQHCIRQLAFIQLQSKQLPNTLP